MKRLKGVIIGLAAGVVLAGCSSKYQPIELETGGQTERQAETEKKGETMSGDKAGEKTETESESEEHRGTETGEGTGSLEEGAGKEPGAGSKDFPLKDDDPYGRRARIQEQTFDVNLKPLGQVTFASYEPDTDKNPLADVVFTIERDGQVLSQLPGTTEDNVGLELFEQVEAVSFLDYNQDGYDDIILIISYYFGAGPRAAIPHSTVRYYKGTAEGAFLYEKEMSEAACSALADITVESAKGFIGVKGSRTEEGSVSLEPWQQAYIEYLDKEAATEAVDGYTLISMNDDEIPELVEVGNCEADGCRIIHFGNGKAHITQLNRLYFDYIPEGNLLRNAEGLMDYYYDLIYSIVDGEMSLIDTGYYGAEDNTNRQFDAAGNIIYQYEWNGVQMSREEYGAELSKVYDTSRAVSYDFESLYSADEVRTIIEGYENGN